MEDKSEDSNPFVVLTDAPYAESVDSAFNTPFVKDMVVSEKPWSSFLACKDYYPSPDRPVKIELEKSAFHDIFPESDLTGTVEVPVSDEYLAALLPYAETLDDFKGTLGLPVEGSVLKRYFPDANMPKCVSVPLSKSSVDDIVSKAKTSISAEPKPGIFSRLFLKPKIEELNTPALTKNLKSAMKIFGEVFKTAEETLGGLHLDTLEVNLEATAEGKLMFIGSGAKVEGKTSFTLTFKKDSKSGADADQRNAPPLPPGER